MVLGFLVDELWAAQALVVDQLLVVSGELVVVGELVVGGYIEICNDRISYAVPASSGMAGSVEPFEGSLWSWGFWLMSCGPLARHL